MNGRMTQRKLKELQAQIKAVKGLPDKWDEANKKDQTNESYALAQCVDELRAALQQGEGDE